MEEITVSAKTLDDAITEAMVQLGVTSDHLDYDVIEKGSTGFLGFGMKQAVIKARRKIEKQDIEDPVIDFSDTVKEVMKDIHPDNIQKDNKKKKDKKNHKDKNRSKQNYKDTKQETKKELKKEEHVGNEDFPVNDEKQPEKEYKPEKPAKSDKPEKAKKQPSERKNIELAKVEDATVNACVEFLNNVLSAMDMKVEITSSIDEDGALCINMDGDNMGVLIGKRGQTLDSLQYLTNRVANKMQEGYVRVKLDTEDYRRRRKETLENLAKNIAHKVKRTRKSASLEPMNPYERRIIHSALQSDKSVTTHSEGEEPYRRVVVTLVRR